MTKQSELNLIKEKWKYLEKEVGVFKYTLNVLKHKYLPGKYKFYSELNPERCQLRRMPQVIPSLFTKFDPNKFNFTKIKPNEKLLDVVYKDTIVSFLINQSPLTEFHSIICPDLEKCHSQLINRISIEFSIDFLLSIDEPNYQIGYNSPGALASVNHLHLHLMKIDSDLYIDNALLQPIGKGDVYRLDDTMPTEAICFLIDDTNKHSVAQSCYALIMFLVERNIAHNIFITPDKNSGKKLKLFVFARQFYSSNKDVTALNVAFCEFSGFFPLGDAQLFETLTEERVISKIKEESGNVYNLIYNFLNEL